MLQRTLFILLLIAIPPGLAAGEFDLSHPNDAFEGGVQPVENQQVPQKTWFGMGYELRAEKGERSLFEDSAIRRSVFSESGDFLAIPPFSGGEVIRDGAPGDNNSHARP
jgi:hypothetical protein